VQPFASKVRRFLTLTPEQITMANIDPTAGDKTIDEWCQSRRINKSSFYKMRKLGLSPDELVIPGLKITRITAEADARWQERMAELANSKKAKLEVARRNEQRKQAGILAAQSPRHVSRAGRQPKRQRRG
jgi:hypothetical protein